MKTLQDYLKKSEEIEKLGFGKYIDMCVDSENVYPLTEKDDNYWTQMYVCLIDSVRMRAEEHGIDISDYGI